MRYVSLFSGIEAASVAWHPLGWEAVAYAEIEPFPCELLAYRFPDVPNLGDVTKIDWEEFVERYGRIDLVCGGSPCQSFSIAGGRESLDGESRLMFEYIRAVQELRPRWFVWENVPGVLNTKDDAFGCFLDQMDEGGYSTAWRVLDAQFFGVAQRRRRVWAVGASRDAFGDTAAGRAAAVLFERDSLRGNTITSREKRSRLASAAERCAGGSYTLKLRHTGSDNRGGGQGPLIQDDVSATLATSQDQTLFCIQGDIARGARHGQNGKGYSDDGTAYTLDTLDVHAVSTLRMATAQANAEILDDAATTILANTPERPILCMASSQSDASIEENISPCITAAAGTSGNNQPILCMGSDTSKAAIDEDMASTLHVGGGQPFIAMTSPGRYAPATTRASARNTSERGK